MLLLSSEFLRKQTDIDLVKYVHVGSGSCVNKSVFQKF